MDNVRWRVEPTLIILRGVWILEYLCEDNFVNERFLPNIFAVIEYYSFSGLSIFACPFDIHYLCNCYQNLQKRGTLQTRCQCIGDVMVSVDDEVRLVLDQHAELVFYSSSSLKQQSVGRHVALLGHIILFRANQSLLFLLNAAHDYSISPGNLHHCTV
jgi:hypothetical protein